MKNRFRKILAGIVTFAVLGVTAAVPAFAADKTDTGTGSITGNVTINGSISPLTMTFSMASSARPRSFKNLRSM